MSRRVLALLGLALAVAFAQVVIAQTELIEIFDENGDGGFDADEITHIFEEFEAPIPDPIDHAENTTLCLEATVLLAQYDADGSGLLTGSEATGLISHAIQAHHGDWCHEAEEEDDDDHPSLTKAYGGMLLSTIIISLFGGVTVFLYPLSNSKWVLSALVMLAVGTMVGDAALHLIPEALGVHSHEEEGHEDEHGDEHGEEEKLDARKLAGIMVCVPAAILAFLLMERVVHALGAWIRSRIGEPASDDEKAKPVSRKATKSSSTAGADSASATESAESVSVSTDSADESEQEEVDDLTGVKPVDAPLCSLRWLPHIKAFGWMNLFSDGFHNLIDGLVIGVAFAADIRTGISTAIAILLHEIPQEFGDFGVLFKSGMAWYHAVVLNVVSAILAILGGFIGVAVATKWENAQPYMLAFTAGGFIYMAVAGMIPQLSHAFAPLRTLWECVWFVIGVSCMILIAVYGEK